MARPISKFPLEKVLELRQAANGALQAEFPASACFGIVTIGGLVASVAHKAASQFVSRSSSIPAHQHVLHTSINFFRPTLPSPEVAEFYFETANVSKIWTTVHFKMEQKQKTCVSGYFILTDLSKQAPLSRPEFPLFPSPDPVSLRDLETDTETRWVSYLTPFSSKSYRNAQAYIRYCIPVERQHSNILDQWMTPGWTNDDLAAGTRWTNELIHFAIDDVLPMLGEVLQDQGMAEHDKLVAAGRAQKEARLNGKDDSVIWGEGLHGTNQHSWIVSTLTMSTDIKRLLPDEGVRWLFLRTTVRSLVDNKMDYEIIVRDECDQLIAVSHHLMQVIPTGQKNARKAVL